MEDILPTIEKQYIVRLRVYTDTSEPLMFLLRLGQICPQFYIHHLSFTCAMASFKCPAYVFLDADIRKLTEFLMGFDRMQVYETDGREILYDELTTPKKP